MKKLRIVIALVLAACALQACSHKSGSDDAADTNDTTTAVTDTSTTINLVVDKYDTDFATEAANGGLTEVELGKLAMKNGKSKQVKNYGMMMVKEHGKSNTKLIAIMQAKKLTVPAIPDTASQKLLSTLAKKSGDDFDKTYINMMIADHKDDLKEFSDASKKVQDPDLQKFAEKNLPVLQKHLDAINAIHDSMGH